MPPSKQNLNCLGFCALVSCFFLPRLKAAGVASITVSSPLGETATWLKDAQSKHKEWVDCEIGHFARVVLELDIAFAGICIISDDLVRHYDHDLTNEHLETVAVAQDRLSERIDAILLGLLPDSQKTKVEDS